MSQLWLRETNELAQRSKTNSLVRLIFRCGSLDLRPWPFLLQHDSSTVKKPAKRQGSHTEKFSVFAFPLPSSFCQEGYLTNPRSLWEDYPHVHLPFQVKFFYLCQLAYWLHALPELYFQKVRKEEIPRQLQYICLYLVHIAGAYLLNLSRLGLILLLLQYSTEFLFHTARLFYFADENNEKLFSAWAAVFGVTRLFILTLAVLAIGFGLARMENQAFDPEKGNFNTLFCRLCVLLLVCAAQAWLMWRFIHSQLRHWREYWNEQSAKRRVPATPRLPARLIKRESGYHENGVVKAENGTSPRTKKLKSP
ncbi:translocating chain-associated membrane protein 2 isoform X1 [Macaca mulatta]|uniref:translocating chain-associated membrane protein 2 isoform X1 n=1 Tax=Macaca mulatta TaxID=9544 RepID=UPI0010A25A02|nr:translocating chain-associated membrane protein 2 isoform X1 [Macaca mulatta]